jgi:hypothetical protein
MSPAIVRTLSFALAETLTDTVSKPWEIVLDDVSSVPLQSFASRLLTMLNARAAAPEDTARTRLRIYRPEVRSDTLVTLRAQAILSVHRTLGYINHSTVYEFRAVQRGTAWREERTEPFMFAHSPCAQP